MWRSLDIEVANMPTSRYAHNLIATPNNEILIWGGYNSSSLCDPRLWRLNTSTIPTEEEYWQEFPHEPDDPIPLPAFTDGAKFPGACRVSAAADYAILPTGEEVMAVFGGRQKHVKFYDELWFYHLSNNSWVRAGASGPTPPPRDHATLTFVREAAALYLFGGRAQNLSAVLNDLWRYSLAAGTWTRLAPGGAPPPPRQRHSAVAWHRNLGPVGGEDPDPPRPDSLGNASVLVFGGEAFVPDQDNLPVKGLNDLHLYLVGADRWVELSRSRCELDLEALVAPGGLSRSRVLIIAVVLGAAVLLAAAICVSCYFCWKPRRAAGGYLQVN